MTTPKVKTGCDRPDTCSQMTDKDKMTVDQNTLGQDMRTYNLDEQVGFLLRLASQRHAVIFQQMISHKLTPMQFSTLIRVAEHGQLSQNHLGRLAAMDIATIKGVVDRLKAKGLLVSGPHPNDKRRSVISLTEQGQAIVKDLMNDGHAISCETMAGLSATEQKTLLKLLRKIS